MREDTGAGSNERVMLVDWSLAAATGALLVGGGPAVSREEADRAVAELTEMSVRAERHVRELTGLGAGLPIPEATVVDRPGWIRSAAAGLDVLTSNALGDESGKGISGPLAPLLTRAAGVQTGLALAFLGTKVLGQYDPFGGPDADGRLLIVAPNVVQAERALKVSSDDFRMWVCLHESTHRLQFTAVSWLTQYFADEVTRFISSMDDTATNALSKLPEVVRGAKNGPSPMAIFEALQSPTQRRAFDRLLALSTLLEGHADYVMDAVGPKVVPTVEEIRRKFTERRKGGGLLDRLLRSLLGLDAKIKQYEHGAAFTRHVVGKVGMDGFNAVWRSPNTLPGRAEIDDPDAWLRRIHK